MRAEGGEQVQVPTLMTVMINDVLRPCFFFYISLSSFRATNTGLSRVRGIYYVPKLSHTY